MNKIILMLLTAAISTNALGGWINADSMALGEDATSAFGGMATLSWADKKLYQEIEFQALQVNQSTTDYPGNHTQYFGGSRNNNGTTNVMDLYLEHAAPMYASTQEQSFYQAIAVTFVQPISTFSFKAESFSGDSQLVLFFDVNGQFLNHQNLLYTSVMEHPNTGNLFDYSYSFDLRNQNIGSVILGSESSATYYYALQAEGGTTNLPEPSSALLVIGAFALLIIARIRKKPRTQKIAHKNRGATTA